MKTLVKQSFSDRVISLIEAARAKTVAAVNLAMVYTYYEVGGKGSELIDTHELTHLACLWYSVNHEEDKDNRALLVLSSDEPVGAPGFLSG